MKYQIVNGTSYHAETSLNVIKWLETSRERKQRIRLFYGDTTITCHNWNEENDTIGHVGRSTGSIKIPLLIKNSRSFGGGAILDHCIIRIDTKDSKGKIVTVYRLYPDSRIEAVENKVIIDHYNTHAVCEDNVQAIRLAKFMRGERWAK